MQVHTNPYEELANAIVLAAVKDYRKALKTLKKNPTSRSALDMKAECERFFLSQYFQILTSVDGERLMRKLQEE